MTVQNKIILVTGASTGIGRATVNQLSSAGAQVVSGIFPESQLGTNSSPNQIPLDVRSQDAWDKAISYCLEQMGGLDILVNNAGILIEGTAEETDDDTWDQVLDVNLKGLFRGCRTVIPEMRMRGGGIIVNISSIDALRGASRHLAYSASKGGVTALTRSLATDHAADGIRVNAVCPGTIETPMVSKMFSDSGNAQAARDASVAKHPIGRLASPEEVASVISFLCSSSSSFVTGQAISVDGGRSIR